MRQYVPIKLSSLLYGIGLQLGSIILYYRWRHPNNDSLLGPSTAYGLLIILSFCGWGTALARALGLQRRVDFGLRCCWGMALLSFLGGVLMLLHLASRGTLITSVVFGVLLLWGDVWLEWIRACPERPPVPRRNTAFALGATVVLAMLFLRMVAEHHHPSVLNRNDDPPAYWAFVQEVLQTGGCVQPFSLRRLWTYGGQTLFQAIVVTGIPLEKLGIFDLGICPLVLGLTILGQKTARHVPRAVLLAPMLMLALSTPVNNNSATYFSGTLAIVALYRTMTLFPPHRRVMWVAGTLVALLTALAFSLRPNLGLVSAAAVGISTIFRVVRRKNRPKYELYQGAIACGLTLLFVSPWAISCLIQFHTPMFPLSYGTYMAASASFGMATPMAKRLWALEVTPFAYMRIETLWCFFVAAFALKDPNPRRATYALLIASMISSFAIVGALHEDTLKYSFPQELAVVLAMAATAAATSYAVTAARAGVVLVGIATLLQIRALTPMAHDMYKGFLRDVQPADAAVLGTPVPPDTGAAAVLAQLQEQVPEGEPIVTMTQEAFRLNFARNRIVLIDMPGMVSPPPGLPLFEDSDAVASYFLSHSIRYALVGPWQQGLYDKGQWARISGDKNMDPSAAHAPFFLQAMDIFDALSRERKVIASEAGIRVIDLATEAAP